MKRVTILLVAFTIIVAGGCKKNTDTDKKTNSKRSQKELFAAQCQKATERMATCAPELAKQHPDTPESRKRCILRAENTYKTDRTRFTSQATCLEITDCKKFLKCAFAGAKKRRVPPPK